MSSGSSFLNLSGELVSESAFSYFFMAWLNPHLLMLTAAGTFAGIYVGAIPGLSVTMAVSILISFTFAWDINNALALMRLGALRVDGQRLVEVGSGVVCRGPQRGEDGVAHVVGSVLCRPPPRRVARPARGQGRRRLRESGGDLLALRDRRLRRGGGSDRGDGGALGLDALRRRVGGRAR